MNLGTTHHSDIPHLLDWANAMALSPAIIGRAIRRDAACGGEGDAENTA